MIFAINSIERYLFSLVCSELVLGIGVAVAQPRAQNLQRLVMAPSAPRDGAIERCSIAKIYYALTSSSIARKIYYAILKNLLH